MLMVATVLVAVEAGQRKGGGQQGPVQDRPSVELQQKDLMKDRDRIHARDQVQLRDEEIYGHELMSRTELSRYRKELARQTTAENRAQFEYEHEERMRERAKVQGKDLVPPGQGPIYRGELMSVEERNEYRERLRTMKTDEDKERFEAQHRAQMQTRLLKQDEKEEAE
jgi:hypothetical protein